MTIDLTKVQIDILLSLIMNEDVLRYQLKKNKYLKLKTIGNITGLEYFGCLHRYKDWLMDNEILVQSGIYYTIDFNAIAELLFDRSKFKYIYNFALKHLEYWE